MNVKECDATGVEEYNGAGPTKILPQAQIYRLSGRWRKPSAPENIVG